MPAIFFLVVITGIVFAVFGLPDWFSNHPFILAACILGMVTLVIAAALRAREDRRRRGRRANHDSDGDFNIGDFGGGDD